jgi:peptide deformylase
MNSANKNKLTLKYFGEDILRQRASEIKTIDDSIVELSKQMHELLKRADGVGLAAPQIGVSKRIIVIDLGDKKNIFTVINPEIVSSSSELINWEEGCLSVPGINIDVLRPAKIIVKGQSVTGKEVNIEADGLLARVFQHEIDHLDGILFIDRIEKFKKDDIRSELKQIKKLGKGK